MWWRTVTRLLVALAIVSCFAVARPAGSAPIDERTLQRITAIDMRLEVASTQFEKAFGNLKALELQERNSGRVGPPVAILQRKLSLVRVKFKALATIDQLLTERIKLGEALPLGKQIAFVQQQRVKAEARKEKDPCATTLNTVLSLMKAEARLRGE